MQLSLHRQMTNEEISSLLEFVADVLLAKEANQFRINAYRNAAAAISAYAKPLRSLPAEPASFRQVPAVGEAIADKLAELFQTGNIVELQDLVADVPAGMRPLTQIEGIGGKRAFQLAKHFQLRDEKTALAKLLTAAKSGDIRELSGFGVKSESDIITKVEGYAGSKQRIPYEQAHRISQKLLDQLTTFPEIERAEVMGSLRRQSESIGDIDIGLTVNNIGSVKKRVKNMKNVKRVIVAGDQLISLLTDQDVRVDLKIAPAAEWGSFLQHFTGSREHNILLREYALTLNMSLSEHGIKLLHPTTGEVKQQLKFSDEEKFYEQLGFNWIPPQERTGQKELDRYKINHK